MDIIHTFDNPPVLFEDTYEFVRVISIPPVKERTAILLFKEKQPPHTLVTVRCLPDVATTQKEIRTLFKVEKMRKELNLRTIVKTHGYLVGKDPFKLYDKIPKDKAREEYVGMYYYIIMDYLPIAWDKLDQDSFGLTELTDLTLELLYTIWITRLKYKFHHGDLHPGNIMLVPVTGSRKYRIDNISFECVSDYMPVIIDFEKSLFEGNQLGKFSDVRLILSSMHDFVQKYQINNTDEFYALYNTVISFDWTMDKDNRFKPEVIPRLLQTQPFFQEAIQVEEPQTKVSRIKTCISCKTQNPKFVCSHCKVFLCSEICMAKSYKDNLTCHK